MLFYYFLDPKVNVNTNERVDREDESSPPSNNNYDKNQTSIKKDFDSEIDDTLRNYEKYKTNHNEASNNYNTCKSNLSSNVNLLYYIPENNRNSNKTNSALLQNQNSNNNSNSVSVKEFVNYLQSETEELIKKNQDLKCKVKVH